MIFKIVVPGQSAHSQAVVSIRCPGCRQLGTYEALGSHDVISNEGVIFGQRRCPNPECRAHIFIVWHGGRVVASYPAERIDFDVTNVPPKVVAPLEEAITCHANQCFIAAAIMVRKTLEELCADRSAKGANLKERLQALSTIVVLPSELLSGLDDIRLLGNDAAHVESKEYDRIGKDEVEIGIEFTEEVLKAVYQYSTLLKKLRALKKPAQ